MHKHSLRVPTLSVSSLFKSDLKNKKEWNQEKGDLLQGLKEQINMGNAIVFSIMWNTDNVLITVSCNSSN